MGRPFRLEAGQWRIRPQRRRLHLYGVTPTSGTFVFSAMLTKGHRLQWVVNYTDPNNYDLFQIDDNNFYRTDIRNGQKTNDAKIPHKGDKKSFAPCRFMYRRLKSFTRSSKAMHGSFSTGGRCPEPISRRAGSVSICPAVIRFRWRVSAITSI